MLIADTKVEAPRAFRITRAVFIITNAVYCFLGIAVIAIGLYFKVGKEEYFKLFNQYEFEVASALLIAAGVMALVTAIIGFFGIVWKIEIVLIFYFMMVAVIFAIELAAGALAFSNKDKAQREIETRLLDSMKVTKLRPYWDKLQREQDCCGVNYYTDWHTVTTTSLSLPDSCCRRRTRSCGRDPRNIHPKGCYKKLDDFLSRSDTAIMVGAAGITIGLLQIVLVVVAVILVVQLRKYRKAKAQFLYTNELL